MYDDESKAKMIEAQRNHFQLATVTYDRGGFEPASVSGYVTFRQLAVAAQQSPAALLFGSGTSGGPVTLMLIADQNTAAVDQEITEIPLTRIISVVYAPAIP